MKLRVPHTYVLLISIMILAAASTWIIPAGRYDVVSQGGREIIDPASYHRVNASPAGIVAVAMAFPKALVEVADIVFYIFIIGGAFGVLNGTGTIQASIHHVVRRIGRREVLIVPVLTLLFAIGGGSIGIAEETLVFLPALLLLSRSLGYDSLVAGGIALVGANAGFASAFMNPFTVGVAQGIVGLPIFSGIEFRGVLWLIVSSVTVVYLTRYAARVKADPTVSLVYHLDRQRGLSELPAEASLTRRHLAVLALCLLALGALAAGAMRWHWGIVELSALFSPSR